MKKCIVVFAMGISLAIPLLANAGESCPCSSQAEILTIIEKAPKCLTMTEKNNVFEVVQENSGSLTITIDGLDVTFFDSRDQDSKNWCSVSNKQSANGLQENIENVGCVIAGINSYETGKADTSENCIDTAQKLFNEYVQITQAQIDKKSL